MRRKETRYLTIEDLPDIEERYSKRYNVSKEMLREIYVMLETDFTLGTFKYKKVSDRIRIRNNIHISPRKLNYIHKVFNNYNYIAKRIKRGNKYKGVPSDIYKGT